MNAHWRMNASPPFNSTRKMMTLRAMSPKVTTGNDLRRRVIVS